MPKYEDLSLPELRSLLTKNDIAVLRPGARFAKTKAPVIVSYSCLRLRRCLKSRKRIGFFVGPMEQENDRKSNRFEDYF